jgi:hypothetical protein
MCHKHEKTQKSENFTFFFTLDKDEQIKTTLKKLSVSIFSLNIMFQMKWCHF